MLESFKTLLNAGGFIPHGHCYLWKSELVWLHVVSDSLIALAYYSIPFMLVYFVRKRRDVPFDWIFLMFGTFIVACGTTHLFEVWTLWHPTYWLSGFIKAITAVASLCTAMLLAPLIPKALALPSPAQLEATNLALRNEITQRQLAEKALQRANEQLEIRVHERTVALASSNESLKLEIAERNRAEEQLRLALDAARMGNWDWDIQTGKFTWSNNLKRLYGLTLHTDDATYETFLASVHPEDMDYIYSCNQHAFDTGEDCDIEFRIVLPDGGIRWIQSKGQIFFNQTGKPVRMTGIDLDITERKLAQIQVQESLQEKEVLLREIHHRVKNNLQVISSLLDLQSQYIEEQTTQEMFRDSQNRVKSMAFVHEQLYQSKNFISIKSADYIKTLTEHLFQSYVMNIGQIDLELDIENFALNINTAIPCSLIINELVSNALKYAFPNTTKGTIKVNLHSVNEKEFILIVKDNGVGFPCNWSFNKLKTLGLQLVNVLVNQLEGTLAITCNTGTELFIKFSGFTNVNVSG